MLAPNGEKVVLFRTKSPANAPSYAIPRRSSGRTGIHLSNSASLSMNLPGPSPEKNNSDIIIHIDKPVP
jgi:hypothetical protein